MSKKQPTWLDGIMGSQIRDTQGEILDIAGADISELEAGRGRWNDNHGAGFFNSIGRITTAKKIFKIEDCENERHRYYWDKIKAPYIYGKGYLYDDEDHPNARAAAAILRNIHRADTPLKLKISVEGGVISRGISDSNLLARTKIHSGALTFTPANNATLVEPLNLDKSDTWTQDEILIKSVLHLAKTNVPSFRHITRRASAEKIVDNFEKARNISKQLGLKTQLPEYSVEEIIQTAVESKITNNINKISKLIKASIIPGSTKDVFPKTLGAIKLDKDGPEVMAHHIKLHEKAAQISTSPESRAYHRKNAAEISQYMTSLTKALTAGYGGTSAPTDRTGGGVLQSETLDDGRKGGFKHIKCNSCGDEQIYMKHQVKCRKCNKTYPFADLVKVMAKD